jgi:plasmid stabilization system protein ParE
VKRKRLRVHSQAQEEINEAFEWYFKRSPEAAEAFLAEIGTCLKKIVSHPQIHSPYTRHTRRGMLAKFPYSVIFLEKDEIILIVAVAHAKRRPGYWARRL